MWKLTDKYKRNERILMKKIPLYKKCFLILLALAFSACATIVKDSKQQVFIDSEPRGVRCRVYNSRGTVDFRRTPFVTDVKRSFSDLTTVCNKPGYLTAQEVTSSSSNGWIWGNLIIGGLLGLIMDLTSGNSFDYPQNIVVILDEAEDLSSLDKDDDEFEEFFKTVKVEKVKENRALIAFEDHFKWEQNQIIFVKRTMYTKSFKMRILKAKRKKAVVVFSSDEQLTPGEYILCFSKDECE